MRKIVQISNKNTESGLFEVFFVQFSGSC